MSKEPPTPRKRKRGYRWLKPQTVASLENYRCELLRKLADPSDSDDPRWVQRNLARVEVELAKKVRNRERRDRH